MIDRANQPGLLYVPFGWVGLPKALLTGVLPVKAGAGIGLSTLHCSRTRIDNCSIACTPIGLGNTNLRFYSEARHQMKMVG